MEKIQDLADNWVSEQTKELRQAARALVGGGYTNEYYDSLISEFTCFMTAAFIAGYEKARVISTKSR